MNCFLSDYQNTTHDDHCISLRDHKLPVLSDAYFINLSLFPHQKNTIDIHGLELLVIILSGSISVSASGSKTDLNRKSVFEERAESIYITNTNTIEVLANDHCQFILAGTHCLISSSGSRFSKISKNQVLSRYVGSDTYARKVDTIIGSSFQAGNILAGETFNQPGKWSTFPLHKHDECIPGKQSKHEEVFFFQIKQKNGFGFQRIFTEDNSLDQTSLIQNNHLSLIPRGFHPVSAAPETDLYYFWMLFGSERELKLHECSII